MADSLNPLDDERFHDISAASAGDDGELAPAEESPGASGQVEGQWETLGHNGHHPLSGPLGPLHSSALLKKGEAGKPGGRRKLLPFVLGIVGVIVIVGCLGAGAVVTLNLLSLQNSLNSPQTTLDAFYSALHVGDYQTAYDQLSEGYQSRLKEDSFRATFELTGTLQSYQISKVQTQGDQASAAVKVVMVALDGGTTVEETKSVQLVQEDGTWKIDRVIPSLTRVIWLPGQ